MKIAESFQESRLLIEDNSDTIKNEAKKQKGGFLVAFLDSLGASLLANMLAGKWLLRSGEETIRAGEGIIRVGKGIVITRQDF